MRGSKLFVIAAALLPAAAAWAGDEGLPVDVRRFLAHRELCDHWGGEEPYDKARAAEIARGAARDCRGTDRELARLKSRHARRPGVLARLGELDPQVEAPPRHARKAR